MRLVITRHGETEENALGITQGHLPGKLSDLGIVQAKKLALRLKNEKLDYIYSSDLARASDTTKEIVKFHPKVPIEFVKDLRERFLGTLQGKKRVDLGFLTNKSLIEFSHKGVESNEELFNRAKNFLYKILIKHPYDTVLFMGHNGINRALIAVIMNKTPEDIMLIDKLHNTSITIFDIDEDKNHKIQLFNCKKHLD